MAFYSFPKQVVQGMGNAKIGQLSAAFAYGAIFSIGPLLIVLISIIGFVYGQQASQGELLSKLSGTVGPDAAKTIQNLVAHTHKSGDGVFALIIGSIGALLGAAGITSQLQNAFNSILGVVPDPRGGIKRTIYVKVKNAALVVLAGVVVIVSLVISAILTGLGGKLQHQYGTPTVLLEMANNLLSLVILSAILYLLYRTVPDLVIPKKIAAGTALSITCLFVVGKFILAIIIGRNGTASAYGAAATLITLLLWIYYSGQILFIGALGMRVYGANHSLEYKSKKFSLKRTTVHIDGGKVKGSLVEAWVRGFNKGANRKSR
jgi:membrane protein